MRQAGLVWGLDTSRQGEFMQVVTLGNALGLGFERICLSPEGEPVGEVPSAPPRLILSFGRAAQAALRLAATFARRPLLVHLGTPGQIPITAFDLIIPMPQDDYPPAPNVLFLRLPLNGASLAADMLPPHAASGACTLIIGGPSRHFRITLPAVQKLMGFGARLAAANAEALRVVTSPRTPLPVLTELRRLSASQGFALHEYGKMAFAEVLQSGSRFVVTGDSASMLAEACRTGAPVWLFTLPVRLNWSDLLQHGADRCLGRDFRHALVRRGWVGGGTNFRRWHCKLEQRSFIATDCSLPEAGLRWSPRGNRADTDLRECRDRILGMLAAP